MTGFIADPLLAIAKIVIFILQAVLVLCVLGLLGGIVVMMFDLVSVRQDLIEQGVPENRFWLVYVGFLIIAGMMSLWFGFLQLLRQVIDSVGAGDPFAPENAGRLSRMGWLVVGTYALAIPFGLIAAWIAKAIEPDAQRMIFSVDGGSGGLVLVLTLFILARVFRHGSAMRADLEGTV